MKIRVTKGGAFLLLAAAVGCGDILSLNGNEGTPDSGIRSHHEAGPLDARSSSDAGLGDDGTPDVSDSAVPDVLDSDLDVDTGLVDAGPCVAHDPGVVVLACEQSAPVSIAVDSTYVYWANYGPIMDGGVMKVPLAGGAPVTVAAADGPSQVAVDSTSAYWEDIDGIEKVSLDGGTTTTLASGFSDAGFSLLGIAVNSASVYFTGGEGLGDVPIGGGTVSILDPRGEPALAIDSSTIYYSEQQGGVFDVMSIPLAGGTPTTLASEPSAIVWMAVDSTSVYWTGLSPTFEAGVVAKVPLAGGAVTVLAPGCYPGPLAVDGINVYWVDCTMAYGETFLLKVPVSGGTPMTIASGLVNPLGLAVDATSVYWTDAALGTVMKAPK